jgi:hypothetical protein
MPRLLHILTRPDDSLARELIAFQQSAADNDVQVVDLTQPDPDYKALLEKIFATDSVESW